MLTVSLDCLRLVSCVPNVDSVSGLSSSCVLASLYLVLVLNFFVVFGVVFFCFVCLRLVSCVPNVDSVSGMSSSCVLCT